MRRQAIVIGLGQFGMSIARTLSERGVEVLAVDIQESRVRVAAEFAATVACFDASDHNALARTAPERREVCICAIGDESKEASIICTASLRQMGARRIIARSDDELHARILTLVGAHQVVNPEVQFGERFASQILYENVIGELPLGKDLLITEFRPPAILVGRTLKELELPRRHGITVVAVRRFGLGDVVVVPDPDRPLASDDVLIVVSREGVVGRLIERSRT